MKSKVLLFFLSMLAISMHAQELTEEQIQLKEDSVFNIKFSEEAHYAEVAVDLMTQDGASVTLAKQQSMNLLQTHIVEIFAKRLKLSNEAVQNIWDAVEENCSEVEVQRGDLLSVFTYMAKDALKGLFSKHKTTPLTPEDSLILFGPKEKKVLLTLDANPPAVNPDTPVVISESGNESKKEEEAIVVIPPVPVEPKTPEVETPKVVEPQSVEVETPKLCKTIIAKENFQSVMAFLEEGQMYNKLMYGSLNQMQYLSKCYVVILNRSTQKVEAVLDRGESGRMNFITKKMDYYGNYPKDKFALIFVQEL